MGALFSSLPEHKPEISRDSLENGRKKAILEDEYMIEFGILNNRNVKSDPPIYRVHVFNDVLKYEDYIEHESSAAKIDPDIVKAIIYLETSQGYYDSVLGVFGLNKTIRPMNIHASYWKDLGYSRGDLQEPRKNIQAGIKIIKKIQENMPGASVAEIATVYNNLGATEVSRYGARVERVYNEKAWER